MSSDPAEVRPDRRTVSLHLLVALAGLALLTWWLSCAISDARERTLDDSFITYVYGRNLAEGSGLRFNPSDEQPTEGYSSLLHVLLSAATHRLDWDPLTASRGMALVAFLTIPVALAIAITSITAIPFATALLSAVAVQLAFAKMPETVIHLAQGMETVLFLTLHGWTLAWALRLALGERRPTGWSTLVGVTLLLLLSITRPEGAVLAAAYLVVVGLARGIAVNASTRAARIRELGPSSAAFGLAFCAYLVWKFWYFGHLLPNAYFVKSSNAIFGSSGTMLPGLWDVTLFFAMRCAPLAILAVALAWRAGLDHWAARTVCLLLLPSLLVVVLYTRAIHEAAGGFRYEYPYLIPLVAMLAWSLAALSRREEVTFASAIVIATVCLPILSSPRVAGTFLWMQAPIASAVAWQKHHHEGDGLGRMGRDLRETGLGGRATILLSGAGQVPYFSRFVAIDWLGLNNNVLSGRQPLTLVEVWEYIDSFKPDVVYSFLPPAGDGTNPAADPGFRSPSVTNSLNGRGTELFKHWRRETVADMFYREMSYIRDHYAFGAAYRLYGDWALIAYVRRDSPHHDAIARVLRASVRSDRETDLSRLYVTDPRKLGHAVSP